MARQARGPSAATRQARGPSAAARQARGRAPRLGRQFCTFKGSSGPLNSFRDRIMVVEGPPGVPDFFF